MSFESLLVHSCNIYARQLSTQPRDYGAPDEEVVTYPDTPTYNDVPCYIVRSADRVQPGVNGAAQMDDEYDVSFLISQPVSFNDKITWNGIILRLQEPLPIRNHHIKVKAVRVTHLK